MSYVLRLFHVYFGSFCAKDTLTGLFSTGPWFKREKSRYRATKTPKATPQSRPNCDSS
jgi:hypothetical protein